MKPMMRMTTHGARRAFCVWLALLLLLATAVQAAALKPPFEVQAGAVYAQNLETGEVVLSINADEKMFPASTTKIMTALLVLENIPDLQQQTVYSTATYEQMTEVNRREYGGLLSMAGLLPGETLSVEQALYGLLLPSGNECAYLLAELVGGSIEGFAAKMNVRAQQLGAKNTHFTNPAGLEDENNYTTARDLFLIANAAMQNETFRTIVGTATVDSGPTGQHDSMRWNNTNALLLPTSAYYTPGVYGIKTGTLDSAGRCLVSAGGRDGLNYLMVMLGAPLVGADGNAMPYNTALRQSADLYEWLFSSLMLRELVAEGADFGTLPLQLAKEKQPTLALRVQQGYTALLPVEVTLDDFARTVELPESVQAPVQAGDVLGTLRLAREGKTVCTLDLVSAETVERDELQYVLYCIRDFIHNNKLPVAAAVVLLLLLLALLLIRAHNLRRRKKHARRAFR